MYSAICQTLQLKENGGSILRRISQNYIYKVLAGSFTTFLLLKCTLHGMQVDRFRFQMILIFTELIVDGPMDTVLIQYFLPFGFNNIYNVFIKIGV